MGPGSSFQALLCCIGLWVAVVLCGLGPRYDVIPEPYGCALCCRGAVWCVCWSTTHEHQLFTGDASGQVLVWDVRQSAPICSLDQHDTQPPTKRKAMGLISTPSQTSNRKRSRGGSGSSSMSCAHNGSVTDIHVTRDGLHLLTSGRDSRVRLWEAHHLYNTLVHYADTVNKSSRPKQMSTTPDGRHVFNPCGSEVQVSLLVGGNDARLLGVWGFAWGLL